jgi:hypothetical protein
VSVAPVGGKQVTASVHAEGHGYDLGAIVGLLNVLAKDLGSDRRFVVLAANDEAAWVTFGPEAGLRSIIEEGLLRPGSGEHAHWARAFV